MKTTSTWQDRLPKNSYPSVSGDLSCDVAIIGGGLAGILSAYMLAKAGKKVIVLEAEDGIGRGATSLTTACITQVIDTDLREAQKLYGARSTKLIWESHGAAIDLIEKIVSEEKINCSFKRCSNFLFASSKRQASKLKKEAEQYGRLGFDAKFSEQGTDGLDLPHFGYIEVFNQAKFHPIKFLSGVAERARGYGARIYTTSPVSSIEGQGPFVLQAPKGRITAQQVIIATYRPLFQKGTRFKKGMYVSYVFEAEIQKDILPEAIYEDLSNPYYYFRVYNGDPALIIIGGEDHRTALPIDEKKNFAALEEFLKRMLHGHPYTVTRRWTGPILEPSDGLALIGALAPDLYVATAFSGNGMTYSAISAMLFSDLIAGKKNIWENLYKPLRIPTMKQLLYKGADYTEELFGGAVQNLLRR
jgi:glycine/D-amino acid oxidase-like deaminating enzyme